MTTQTLVAPSVETADARRTTAARENGCLYFLLGVVRIFSKFGVGCIFFQYLVTNYIFCGSRKDWLHLLFRFGKLFGEMVFWI